MTAEPLYIAFKCDECKQFVSAKLSVRDNGRGTKYQQLYCSVCSKTTGQTHTRDPTSSKQQLMSPPMRPEIRPSRMRLPTFSWTATCR